MYIDLNIHFHLPQGSRNKETGMQRMTSMKFIQLQVHLSISLSENNETRIEFQLFMKPVNISEYIYHIDCSSNGSDFLGTNNFDLQLKNAI